MRGRTAVLLSPRRIVAPTLPTPTPALPRAVDLGDGVGFEMGIVGEGYYGVEIRRIAGRPKAQGASVEFTVTLRDGPHQFEQSRYAARD